MLLIPTLRSLSLTAALAVALLACATQGWQPPPDTGPGAPPPRQGRTGDVTPQPQPQPQPTSAAIGDDPRVSTSRGAPGGVVLLWPRVIPSAETAALRGVAQPLHQRLFELIQKALPGRHIDIRPEPQRVCPQAGCEGIAVGVLLLAQGSGCVAVVQVSPPGRSSAHQVAWAGDVKLKRAEVAFREPPEQHVLVKDYAACDRLLEDTQARDDQVILAIAAATGRGGR